MHVQRRAAAHQDVHTAATHLYRSPVTYSVSAPHPGRTRLRGLLPECQTEGDGDVGEVMERKVMERWGRGCAPGGGWSTRKDVFSKRAAEEDGRMGVQAHALVDASQHVLELHVVLQRGLLPLPHDSFDLLHCLPSRTASSRPPLQPQLPKGKESGGSKAERRASARKNASKESFP